MTPSCRGQNTNRTANTRRPVGSETKLITTDNSGVSDNRYVLKTSVEIGLTVCLYSIALIETVTHALSVCIQRVATRARVATPGGGRVVDSPRRVGAAWSRFAIRCDQWSTVTNRAHCVQRVRSARSTRAIGAGSCPRPCLHPVWRRVLVSRPVVYTRLARV